MPARRRQGDPNAGVTTLPIPITTFVGRARELGQVRRALASARLVTLVGAGGCGKTRLAIESARLVASRAAIPVAFADLGPVVAGEEVAPAVAFALGIRPEATEPYPVAICRWLGDRELLVVLDNCEHVIEVAARLAAQLLGSAARLRILATSREPLDLAGELTYRVPSLSLPDAGMTRLTAQLASSEALRLFLDRARLATGDFAMTGANVDTVTDICRRLDGMPLAIELAAARLRHLDLEQIHARLGTALDLLVRGERVAASRQRTLRSTIEWSYDLLTTEEQRFFRRLAVFVGGFSLEAAAAISELDEHESLALMSELVDKSLVFKSAAEVGRYGQLHTLRQFGLERLTAAGELPDALERRAAFFQNFAARANAAASTPDQPLWLDQLELDYDNLRATLSWLAERDPASARRLIVLLGEQWGIHGHVNEARAWADTLLAGAPSDRDRVALLGIAAWLANRQQDHDHAAKAALEATKLSSELGDIALEANSLMQQGLVARNRGDFGAARDLLDAGYTRWQLIGRPGATALALRGHVRGYLGDVPGGMADIAEALERLGRSIVPPRSRGYALTWAGDLALKQGDVERAAPVFDEALRIFRAQQDPWVVALLLDGFAHLAVATGAPSRALRLAAASAALRDAIGGGPPAVFAMNERDWLPAARASVGRQAAAVEREAGTWSLGEAADYALAIEGKDSSTGPLSRREREVAVLVAEGLTSREIADRLFISVRTAENHIGHIRMKLDIRSRAQLARWVVDQGWLPSTG